VVAGGSADDRAENGRRRAVNFGGAEEEKNMNGKTFIRVTTTGAGDVVMDIPVARGRALFSVEEAESLAAALMKHAQAAKQERVTVDAVATPVEDVESTAKGKKKNADNGKNGKNEKRKAGERSICAHRNRDRGEKRESAAQNSRRRQPVE
jgi:hypothetical protein